eukprot:TRINITY_DN6062_c0_g1_i5.p1 TRINITY_DN6062_c0_g1~~TRINITY_DN6062_c0_g1_i5.p1  ORF type:complete len:318 (+),score=70.83 TRINITY_DN6062_c0_g1_i5:143-1096(+)
MRSTTEPLCYQLVPMHSSLAQTVALVSKLQESLRSLDVKLSLVSPEATSIMTSQPKLLLLFWKQGCRDVKKGNTAAESIKKDFIEADVSVVALDLSSLKSVETCVNALKGQVGEGNIDLLVNNAGAMVAPSVSADGFDCQYQTNYLGHFALTQWMLDERLFSTNARIINVGSVMYLFASGDLKKTMLSGARGRVMQYCCTKLMNLLFTLELNRRLDSKFQALCVHPGMVATDFIDHFIPRWLRTISTPMLESFQITPEESAHAIVNACLGKSLDGASGVYLNLCDIKAPSTLASSESLAKELWETSQQQITRNNHES